MIHFHKSLLETSFILVAIDLMARCSLFTVIRRSISNVSTITSSSYDMGRIMAKCLTVWIPLHVFLSPLQRETILLCLICFPGNPSRKMTLKAPITTAADNLHTYFFHCFSEKIRLDVSNESSARRRSHMKNQVLFSSKDKSK